jgi:hypothetical protein
MRLPMLGLESPALKSSSNWIPNIFDRLGLLKLQLCGVCTIWGISFDLLDLDLATFLGVRCKLFLVFNLDINNAFICHIVMFRTHLGSFDCKCITFLIRIMVGDL